MSIDKRLSEKTLTYHGMDCIDVFLKKLEEEEEMIRDVFQRIQQMKDLTDEQKRLHRIATTCCVCNVQFSADDQSRIKVRDHCHITGE